MDTHPLVKLDLPRGVRRFMPPFGKPFSEPFVTVGAAANWWDAGGWPSGSTYWVYQAKSGNGIVVASLAASYTNLAHPGTNDLAPGTAPTWSAGSGWTFNGSTTYLTTGIVPDQHNTWTVMAQFANATNGSDGVDYLIAVDNGNATASVIGLCPRPLVAHYYGNGKLGSAAGNLAAGNMCVAGLQIYLNGVSDGVDITSDPAATGSRDFYIGARHGLGTDANPCFHYKGDLIALILCNKTLTSVQVPAKAAQMALI